MSKPHTETITFVQEKLISHTLLVVFINGTYRYEEVMILDFKTLVEYMGEAD